MGICWRGQFYVDTCLPFGLRSAPALFNHFAEALDWIMANNYGAQLLHYLDDFLLVGPPGKDTCQEAMSRMLTVCDQLGIPVASPVASEKLEGPTTALTFLGIVLDTSAQQLRLPPDKLEELTGLTRSWLFRHKATKRELLSLIGKLSFAAKVVPAGRLFLRRLIDLSTTVRKLHHHISLNAEARANIRWWDCFLPSWNGVAMFLDPEWTAADSLQLYTDASGSLGLGAYFNGAWFRGDWQPHQRLPLRFIQWQELFTIVAAASTWGHLWAGLRIHFHCDNLPIVQAWARQSAKHHDLMQLLRTLNHHLQLLLNSTMAPSTATTYATGIRRYQDFCHAFKLIPVPGTHTICSPPQPDPELQDHSGAHPPQAHMTAADCGDAGSHAAEVGGSPSEKTRPSDAQSGPYLGFFGFLRVSEFTLKNRRFDPRYHPTRQDISWTGEDMHFFIKRSKTDQMGKGTTICIGRTEGRHTCPVAAMEAYRGCCRCPIQSSPLFHFRDGRPLTSKSFCSTFLSLVEQCGYNPAQYNTHSLCISAATAAARAGLPTETIQKLGRWQSSAYQTYTRHPLTHPSDTRTMAAQ
ncbi:hypothetical protein EMCRGX_G007617 [Ephydatia muelleri]